MDISSGSNLPVPHLQQLGPDVSLDQMALPQVGHPPHHAELAVAESHHRRVGEHQRLVALLGLGDLGHDRPDDEGVNDAAHDALQHDRQHRQGARLGHAAEAVADGGLRLQGEEEGRHEAVHLQEAGLLRPPLPRLRPRGGGEVPVGGGDQPEGESEEQPGEEEGEGEDHKHPAPADVHAGGEEVREVALAPLAHVDGGDVAAAVLAHEAAPAPAAAAGGGGGKGGGVRAAPRSPPRPPQPRVTSSAPFSPRSRRSPFARAAPAERLAVPDRERAAGRGRTPGPGPAPRPGGFGGALGQLHDFLFLQRAVHHGAEASLHTCGSHGERARSSIYAVSRWVCGGQVSPLSSPKIYVINMGSINMGFSDKNSSDIDFQYKSFFR